MIFCPYISLFFNKITTLLFGNNDNGFCDSQHCSLEEKFTSNYLFIDGKTTRIREHNECHSKPICLLHSSHHVVEVDQHSVSSSLLGAICQNPTEREIWRETLHVLVRKKGNKIALSKENSPKLIGVIDGKHDSEEI